MRPLIVAIGLLTGTAAFAAPMSLSTDGRLLDPGGTPFNGDHLVLFGLYPDADINTDASWSQSGQVSFEDGYYSAILTGFANADLDGTPYLGITVDGVPLLPRQPLTSVPYAVIAGGVSDNTATCNASTTALHGSLRYRDGNFEGCTPDGWTGLGATSADGSSPSQAATSCLALHQQQPTYPSAIYWVQPATTPFQTWCDMTPGDAGWTLVAHKQSNGSDILSDSAQGSPGEPWVSTTHFKVHTDRIDEVQSLSTTWRVYGSVSGRETDIAATGLPASNWTSNEYRQLRNLLVGRGMSGCGADTWAIGEIYPTNGVAPGTSCYAYPTTANFYDYKSNPSGGNGQGQTIWLR